jgi:hypothetical protein
MCGETVFHKKNLVVVLLSAQAETLRLLDDSEDIPLRCWKQESL